MTLLRTTSGGHSGYNKKLLGDLYCRRDIKKSTGCLSAAPSCHPVVGVYAVIYYCVTCVEAAQLPSLFASTTPKFA